MVIRLLAFETKLGRMRFRCYRLRGNTPLFVLDWGRTFGFHAHETRPAGETMEIRKEAWEADLAGEVWPLSSFRPRLGCMGYDENVRFGVPFDLRIFSKHAER